MLVIRYEKTHSAWMRIGRRQKAHWTQAAAISECEHRCATSGDGLQEIMDGDGVTRRADPRKYSSAEATKIRARSSASSIGLRLLRLHREP